jgi:hypothetical protein
MIENTLSNMEDQKKDVKPSYSYIQTGQKFLWFIVKKSHFTCYRSKMLKHSSKKLNFIPKRSEINMEVAGDPKLSGFHSSFPSRKDFLIKVLLQYRCRLGFFRAIEMTATKF